MFFLISFVNYFKTAMGNIIALFDLRNSMQKKFLNGRYVKTGYYSVIEIQELNFFEEDCNC